MGLKTKWNDLLWQIRRNVITIQVEVHPTHPCFPAHTEVTGILFKRFRLPLTSFMTPMTKLQQVDVGFILEKVPLMHELKIIYDERYWDSQKKTLNRLVIR